MEEIWETIIIMTITIMEPGSDIFKSEMQTLLNPVNCVGVMGAGLALEFKRRYPAMNREYEKKCKARELNPGFPYIWHGKPKSIINFPTKNDFRNASNMYMIIDGLRVFAFSYQKWGVESVAFPALGCGYGGLNWAAVKPIMESFLLRCDIPVEIYPPK